MTSFTFQVPLLFDYFATFLWALSGAIVGLHKRYDLAGVFIMRYDWRTHPVLPHAENQ